MIAMKAVTLTILRHQLLSLRHPGNEDRRLTHHYIGGMINALVCEEAITYEQAKAVSALALNAAQHSIHKTPWPAGEWYPF